MNAEIAVRLPFASVPDTRACVQARASTSSRVRGNCVTFHRIEQFNTRILRIPPGGTGVIKAFFRKIALSVALTTACLGAVGATKFSISALNGLGDIGDIPPAHRVPNDPLVGELRATAVGVEAVSPRILTTIGGVLFNGEVQDASFFGSISDIRVFRDEDNGVIEFSFDDGTRATYSAPYWIFGPTIDYAPGEFSGFNAAVSLFSDPTEHEVEIIIGHSIADLSQEDLRILREWANNFYFAAFIAHSRRLQ